MAACLPLVVEAAPSPGDRGPLVVGRVDGQDDPRRPPPLPGVDERIEQNACSASASCLILWYRPGALGGMSYSRRFRGRFARECRAVTAAAFELPGKQRQQRVVPQAVMVVEILVPAAQCARDPLRHQSTPGSREGSREVPVKERARRGPTGRSEDAPGVGKTHLAISLAIAAAERRLGQKVCKRRWA